MPVSREILTKIKLFIPPLTGKLHKGQSGKTFTIVVEERMRLTVRVQGEWALLGARKSQFLATFLGYVLFLRPSVILERLSLQQYRLYVWYV